MTNDMTVAMTEAYFRAPPKTDWILLDGPQAVLACAIKDSPWIWNAGLGMLTHRQTGEAKPRTSPTFGDRTGAVVGRINAAVLVQQREDGWQQSDLDVDDPGDDWTGPRALRHPTVVDTKTHYVDGVAKRLRGDDSLWRTTQKEKRRDEQKKRARTFRPADLNARPSEHMTAEDRKRFTEVAKEVMANMAHLTTFLPYTQIMGPRWAQRMLEMVEREMKSLEDYGHKLTEQIVAEHRARGGGGVEEINDMRIEQLERRRAGLRFQYWHCQLLFGAWREQYDEVCGEAAMLAVSLPGVGWNGHTYNYIPLRERVDQRIRDRKETDRAWKAERMMLIGRTEQDFYRYLEARRSYQPRHGQEGGSGEHEVARPWSDTYSSGDDEQVED